MQSHLNYVSWPFHVCVGTWGEMGVYFDQSGESNKYTHNIEADKNYLSRISILGANRPWVSTMMDSNIIKAPSLDCTLYLITWPDR